MRSWSGTTVGAVDGGRQSPRRAGARLVRAAAPAAALAAALALGAPAPAEELRHVVKDPYYGDTLFYFYQQRYFSALTDLMVSQQFARVSHHADEAELLRGGLLLSYGVYREAGEVFERLIEDSAQGKVPPAVRDRAWFYLAKIRYQRDRTAQAEEALDRIGNSLPPDLEVERRLLQAQVRMARGDYAGAADVLKTIGSARGASGVALYARYNLGVALIKSGKVEQGTALLEELGRTPASSEEFRSLRDKANVALGYAALQANDPELAREYLDRVRLNGMLASKALLGFGWAAEVLKQPQKALVPWTELARRDPSDPAVLEAELAVPYVYAELGALAQSLQRYQEAIALFEREEASLDESIAAVRAGKLIDSLIARNPGEEMGWFWNIDALPELPHPGQLVPVLAGHEFQEAFKNFRDLQFLAGNLRRWKQNLGVYRDMLDNRRQAYAERLPQVKMQPLAAEIAALESRRERLAAELAQAQAQADGAAFADGRERGLAERLQRARGSLDRIGTGPDADAARERYRLASGALAWQLAQEFPARLWEAKKGLRDLDAELAAARRRNVEIAQAQRDEPARFERFDQRIAELAPHVDALLARVEELIPGEQRVVQDLAVAELERQKELIAGYATQARFAVAQIYDRADVAKEGSRAPAPAR
jgi:hypothetical protein